MSRSRTDLKPEWLLRRMEGVYLPARIFDGTGLRVQRIVRCGVEQNFNFVQYTKALHIADNGWWQSRREIYDL